MTKLLICPDEDCRQHERNKEEASICVHSTSHEDNGYCHNTIGGCSMECIEYFNIEFIEEEEMEI